MRLFLVAAVFTLLGTIGASASDTRSTAGVFTYRIDPSHPDRDPLDFADSQVRPLISVYSVTPPASMCMAENCWPSIWYFASAPLAKQDMQITVACSAYSASGERLVTGQNWTVARPERVADSIVTLDGGDYSRFGRVDCRVVDFRPFHG